jgi:hypothetical protein
MTTQSLSPILRTDVSWTEWGDGHLLFNPSNRSTLRLESVDHDWILSMDGTVSLHDLETQVSDTNHLLHTLEQLCRGQFFTNSDELFTFLFPSQQRNSWTPPKRQWLFGSLMSKTVHWPLQIKNASAFMILTLFVFCGGLFLLLNGSLALTDNPWIARGDWFFGTLIAYALVSKAMSLSALFQLSMLAAHNPKVEVHLKHTFGILHLGTNRVAIYHTPIAQQRQFAGVGIAMVLFMIGCALIQEKYIVALDGLGVSGAVVLLLVLAWELCPFYDTNGAQLLETVTIHKQRLRTQDFLRSSALGNPFGEVDGQAGLRMTLSIWLLWFGVAIHLLGVYVLPHVSTLLIQTLQYPSIFGQIWLGLICALISIGYVYFLFQGLRLSGNLLEQVIPKSTKVETVPATKEQYEECLQTFSEMHPFENIADAQKITISAGSRIDQSIHPEHIWILLEGKVAFITPKPEGGFSTLFELPPPSVLLCPIESKAGPILWSRSEVQILSLPYRAEQWHTLKDKVRSIKDIPPFADLSPEWQWMLATQASQKTIPAEQYLIEKDTPSDTLYILAHGDVFVEADLPVELTAPAIVGEMGILSEAPRNASIRCTKWCTVIILPAHIIRVCLQHNPSMQAWMSSLVDTRLSKSGGDDEPE